MMKSKMFNHKINFFISLLVFSISAFAQSTSTNVQAPVITDFSGSLKFLASGWMEGREAGTKGGFMAADYIASMMEQYNLIPYNKAFISEPGTDNYFQDFNLISFNTEKSSVSIVQKSINSNSILQLTEGVDYQLTGLVNNCDIEAPLIFAGYGISAPENGYDEYKNIDVTGKIAVVLEGFPGYNDTTSIAWKKLNYFNSETYDLHEIKKNFAKNHGAIALIILNKNDRSFSFTNKNNYLLNTAMNNAVVGEPEYIEDNFVLPKDLKNGLIPTFNFSQAAGSQIIAGTVIDPVGFEKNAAKLAPSATYQIKDKTIRISTIVKNESLLVRNVIGIIPGVDTSKYLIIGGHYDHLGTRNGIIYNGSDDNASGAAGMLALAKTGAQSGAKPSCNLVFASWTAEEKGLLGSRYFAQTFTKDPKNILLYINLDMISRSVAEDSTHNQLSIGTRTQDKAFREMVSNINSKLKKPFILDLWNVTGHAGSDYASFTERNIPIFTFNTGLHNDYHTPRDISPLADFNKMSNVLKIANSCIQIFLENSGLK